MATDRGRSRGRSWWPGQSANDGLAGYWSQDPVDVETVEHADGAEAGLPAPERSRELVGALKRGNRRGQPRGVDASIDDAVAGVTADVVEWPGNRVPAAAGEEGRHPVRAGGGGEVVPFPRPGGLVPADGTSVLTGELAEVEESGDRPQGLRVRGWAGRGPVGLVAVKPPKLLRQRQVRQDALSGLGRWLFGGEWDGRPRTNATWWRFGTKAFAWSDRLPARWCSYPRVLRAAIRWLSLAVAGGVGWLWWTAPTATGWGVGLVGWLVMAASGWAGADSLLGYPHRWRWVWPAQQAVAPLLGYPERTPPRRFLFIPRNFAKAGGQVEVALPPAWTHTRDDETAKALVTALRKVLSLADVEESWHVAHRNHFLMLSSKFRPRIPLRVPADDPLFIELMQQQPWSGQLLGLGAGAVPVASNFATDDPHLLLNGLSGSGKSCQLEGMAAQMLHNGWEVRLCDYKFTSLDSLRGLVTYARWIEEIHLQLVALGQECELRNRLAEAASANGEPKPNFQPLAMFIEEINATMGLLQLWWDTHRKTLSDDDAERYGDPAWKISPARVGTRAGLSMGRERRVHVIGAAQHATTNALGGSEVREQFGERLVGKATAKAWKMLAEDVAHPPVGSQPKGRWHRVRGEEVTSYQGGLWTPELVRAYATSGERVAWSHGHTQPAALGNPARPVTQSHTTTELTATTRGLVTLKEASADEGQGLVAMSHHMLRKLRHRDPAFPQPTERGDRPGAPHRYQPAVLAAYHAEWAASRGKETNQ